MQIYSAGEAVGNSSAILLNQRRVEMAYGQGLNVVVIDPRSGSVTHKQNFDTHQSAEASDAFGAFVEALPFGSIVAIAVQGEALRYLDDRAHRACSMLGSSLIYKMAYRSSWALLGIKGVAPGSALNVQNAGGAAVIEGWIPQTSFAQDQEHLQKLLSFTPPPGFFVVLIIAIVVYMVLYASQAPADDPAAEADRPPRLRPPVRRRRILMVAADYPGTASSIGTRALTGRDDLRRTLVNSGYFNANEVISLSDQLVRADVSLRNVQNALRNLIRDAADGDVLCFYFFGHGLSVIDPLLGRRECLILRNDAGTETARFYDTDLAGIITGVPVMTNLTLIFMACHSAGMADFVPFPPAASGITTGVGAATMPEPPLYVGYQM